jgi:hypothetical protein
MVHAEIHAALILILEESWRVKIRFPGSAKALPAPKISTACLMNYI